MIKPLRHFQYRFLYRNAALLNLKRPIDVSLELASNCNMRCGYCYHSDSASIPFKKGYMDFSIAKLIIVDAASLGVMSIKTNYRGESTLNPKFLDITNFIKDHASGSAFIDRITNSNFKFNNERGDIFEGLCNQTKVKVSFDSFRKDVMEKQRIGSNHDLILKNIDTFYNHPLRIKTDTELVIQSVITKLNKDEDIYSIAKKRWPSATISIRDMVSGRVNKDLSSLENKTRDLENRQSCIQAHARLIFDIEGNAQVCCPDISSKLKVGNILEHNMYDIFNSEAAKEIRRSLKNKSAFDKDPCKSCSSFESFKGYKHPWSS